MRSWRTNLLWCDSDSSGGRERHRVYPTRLKAKGRLAGNEKTLDTLYAVNFTVAERKDPLNYSPGMVVQFHQNVKGFRRGDRAEITERTVDGATVVCHGKVHQLPLDQAARFGSTRKATSRSHLGSRSG